MLEQQKILIIGANSAVARAVARLLAPANTLYFLARDAGKLQQTLLDVGQAGAWCASADFRDIAATQQLIARAWEAANGLDIVLIAHGLLGPQAPTEADFALAEAVIATNFTTVVAQLIAVSRLMECRGRGKIAVISSVAGERGRPRNYTYGAAKGALTLYLQGLRSRLWRSGVEVYTFKMGPVDSPMTHSHDKDFSFSTPARAARIIVDTLPSRRYSRYVPGFWGPVMWVVRWLPEPAFQRLRFLSGR